MGERCIVFTGSLRDSGRMIVPGGFEGAKGSFGECTGINLDVGSSVRSFRGRGGEGEESIGSRSIASVRFARLCNDRRTNRDRHPVFSPAKMQELSLSPAVQRVRRTLRRGWKRGSNKRARVRSTRARYRGKGE